MMRYLGGSSGCGLIKCNGEEIARASYDFDNYFKKPDGVMTSGEIRLSPAILETVFGCKDVHLLTDDGRLLDLRFSEKKLVSDSDVAHVEVTESAGGAKKIGIAETFDVSVESQVSASTSHH